jgi:type IX secretion system PorP/SprF family membrane protein
MKPIRLAILLGSIVYYSIGAKAQVINSELYQFNYLTLNPAFAGKDGQSFSLLAKTIKYPSFNFSEGLLLYETNFDKFNSGFAFTGSSITLGAVSETSLGLSYSYSIRLSKSSKIVIGSRIANNWMNVDFGFYSNIDPTDPIFDPDKNESISNFTFSPGVLAEFGNFYASISIENLLSTNDYKIGNVLIEGYDLYNVVVGYSFKAKDWGDFRHSVFVPLLNGELNRVDLNSVVVIRKKFITGVAFEISDEEILPKVNIGFRVKDFMEIVTMVYSQRREFYSNSNFSGSLSVRFFFQN